MDNDCRNVRLWPDIKARVTGSSPCMPPFSQAITRCKYAFLAVSVPNLAFALWLENVWRNSPKEAIWEIVLALDPIFGTQKTGEVLGRLFSLQDSSEGRLKVRLLTPGKLGDAAPRLSLAVLDIPGETLSMSVGSSPAFGLNVPAAGDVNLLTTLSSGQANAVRQLARAYWETAVNLTKVRCEVPVLEPCRGNEEGYIHWQAFEAMLNDNVEQFGQTGRSIQELPLNEDGDLDEEAITDAGGEPPGLVERIQKIPKIVEDIQALYEKGALVSVQQKVKPMSVPIQPSLFGQQGIEQVGAVRYTQQFRIELFADEATAKEVEQQRKRVTELVKLFSFSLGTGKYWVPNSARDVLNAALDSYGVKSKSVLHKVIGGNLDRFLQGRRKAIQQDLETIYKRFYPNSPMPTEAVEKVMDLLRERAKNAESEGLVPKITSTSVIFRYSVDSREDPWGDAILLLSKIVQEPRDMVSDKFKPRELKPVEMSVVDYLKTMDVLSDAFVSLAVQKGCDSPWVIECAHKELETLKQILESDEPGEVRCRKLLDLVHGTEVDTRKC